MNDPKPSRRGGARPGAGRKPRPPLPAEPLDLLHVMMTDPSTPATARAVAAIGLLLADRLGAAPGAGFKWETK